MNSVSDEIKINNESDVNENTDIYKDLLLIKVMPIDEIMKFIYEINTLDDYMVWFKTNKEKPINTQKRVLDCYLSIYGYDLLSINDDILEVFQKLINNFWHYQLVNKTGLNNIDNIMLKDLIMKYHETHKDRWKNIELHTDTFKLFLFNKLKKIS
jgi:hypothetical protein